MNIELIHKTISEIVDQQELFHLEEKTIRGVRFKTFANGPKNIRDLVDLCLSHGDLDFLVYENERYSFEQFHKYTQRLATVLVRNFNVKKGDRIGLLMRNVPEYPMLFLALGSVGAIPVFLNSWWTAKELEYGFMDSGAKIAFVDQARSYNMAPFADKLGIRRVVVRTESMEKNKEFWGQIESKAGAPLDIPIDPEDDFAIMYTSGSSGHPKGVVMTHRSAVSAIQTWFFSYYLSDRLGLLPDPTIDQEGNPYQPATMVTTPLFHISATHAGVMLAIWFGLKVVLIHKWDPKKAVELIETEKVSRFACVPTMSAELIRAANEMNCKMESLRTIDSGGAKRPASQVADIARNVPHAMPGTGFGMTESGGIGIGMRGALYVEHPHSAGRLQPPLLEMRIVDEEDKEVPVGEVGELVMKSVCNMRCYLNKPEETAKALQNGWLYTGDLAKIDHNEIITIVDRKKDMIIRGGENISASEIQAALLAHNDILEAAAFAVPDERLGEDVACCVLLQEGAELSELQIREFLRKSLATFKIPKNIWFRDLPLPRGATEKIDRLAIRAEYVNQ